MGKFVFPPSFQKQWTPFSISLTGNACQQIPSVTLYSVVKLAIVNTFCSKRCVLAIMTIAKRIRKR
jgi:hypothetical protein